MAKVAKAHITIANGTAVATTRVLGGVAGQKVVLHWGLIDTLQSGESQAEKVLHTYLSTRAVTSYDESVRIPMTTIYNSSLVHFVLYGPDGSFLSSSDTPDFGGS